MRALAAVLVTALLLGPTLAIDPADARTPEPGRWTVDLEDVDLATLHEVASRTPARVTAIDATLGFAVVEDIGREALEDALGAPVSPDPIVQLAAQTPLADAPDDPLFASQWGAVDLNLPQAWAVEDGDASVTVAVIDTGITLEHEDLPYDRIRFGHDYDEDDDIPQDVLGHGTEVAGVIIASRGNGVGIAGVANVELLAIKAVNSSGPTHASVIAQAIREAADAGADIASVSLSMSESEPLADAVAYARAQGTLVIAAAGNAQDNAPWRCVTAPAVYPGAIAVGALEPPPGPGLAPRIAEYSCQGPEVELVAPGSYVTTTTTSSYFPRRGTSFATPYVAGVAALVMSHEPSLTTDEVRERLTSTADDMGDPGRDPVYGHGKVDPVEAMTGWEPVYVPASPPG